MFLLANPSEFMRTLQFHVIHRFYLTYANVGGGIEVALLRAYLLRARLTSDADRADLFLVPALFGSACALRGGGDVQYRCVITEVAS